QVHRQGERQDATEQGRKRRPSAEVESNLHGAGRLALERHDLEDRDGDCGEQASDQKQQKEPGHPAAGSPGGRRPCGDCWGRSGGHKSNPFRNLAAIDANLDAVARGLRARSEVKRNLTWTSGNFTFREKFVRAVSTEKRR